MTDRSPSPPATADVIAAELAAARALDTVRRTDQVERRRDDTTHRSALRDVTEDARRAEHDRRQRTADAREQATLASLYRTASVSGARARLTHQISQSAEARALRVRSVGRWTLRIGIPVLVAFGAWSTAGVHRGVTTLLNLDAGTPGWWAAWLVEPAFITLVGMIIIGRSVLRSAGGDTDWRAIAVMGVALWTSVFLAIAGDWPGEWSVAAVGSLVAAALGPLGAAATAHLIGVFDDYVTAADPWDGATMLADMVVEQPVPPGAVPVPAVVPPPAMQPVEEPTPPPTPARTARQTPPQPGDPEFNAAVDAYRFSVLAGNPMSGRQLCRDHGVNPDNRGWVKKVIVAAQEPVTIVDASTSNLVA